MPIKIHGRLGAADLAAATNTGVYTVPASRKATVSVSLCNRTAADITVRLAHIDGAIGAVANEDYMEYDSTLPANGVIERERVTLAAADTIGVRASATGVSVVVRGIEEDV